MQIAFIGLGKFGQAIASLVTHNGLHYEYAERGQPLTKPVDLIFITVPTQFIRQALETNRQFITDKTIIVNAAKGIEENTHLFAYEIVQSVGPFPYYYSLMGPSFAHGIVGHDPTVVSLGYKDEKHVKAIKKILETPHFRIHEVEGYRALELASALKNLYAIICGYANGLGLGMNTQALLITTALQEFTVMAKAMKLKSYDVLTPGVVGDMMMTCSSEQSRNFQYGQALAKTGDHQKALNILGATVEGYHTSRSIQAIAKEHGVVLPLAFLTHDVIADPSKAETSFRKFLSTY